MIEFQQLMTITKRIWKRIEPDAIPMAKWILNNSENISNLKLQKLLFYCYGTALAFDFDDEVGNFKFEAWKYGPVEKSVYREFAKYESGFIPKPTIGDSFSNQLESKLKTVLKIYGNLTPMELVRQSHLESPWVNAWGKDISEITALAIKNHFKQKFINNPIAFPEVILDSGLFELDKIPVRRFKRIEDLADALDAERFL